MSGASVRLDPKAVASIAALALVIFVIMFVELCGREDVQPGVQQQPQQPGLPTATLGPTFTPGPSPTSGPAIPTQTPSPQPGGRDRDAVRAQDLQALQGALEVYRADHDSYPDTEGAIQTLCVYTEFDVGCELLDVVDELPQEPIGDPSVNGYWYTSDGDTYVLYAMRETDALPECLEHPEFLQDFESILCFSGP